MIDPCTTSSDQLGSTLQRAVDDIRREPVPSDARQRVLDSASEWTGALAVDADVDGVRPLPLVRSPWFLPATLVAALLLVTSVGFLLVRLRSVNDPVAGFDVPRQATPSSTNAVGTDVKVTTNSSQLDTVEPTGAMAPKWIPGVRAAVAHSAPVLVANGPADPVRLGAALPQREETGRLHVWNWSKSAQSRVVDGVELWPSENFVLSPDGRLLLWASGAVLDLDTGKRSTIDLGGATHQVGAASYQRIGTIRFAPDGKRLALTITNFVDGQPGRIASDILQVLEFPSGKVLSEFTISDERALRFDFSSDGRQVFYADDSGHVIARDCLSGKVVRTYEPSFVGQVGALDVSPDGGQVAATDGNDVVLIWNAKSGALVRRIKLDELDAGNSWPVPSLAFSPDGSHLAITCWSTGVFVVEVASGKLAGTIKGPGGSLRWSDDGKSITVVTPVSGAGGGGFSSPRYDIYPSIYEWDWRTGKSLRSLTSPRP